MTEPLPDRPISELTVHELAEWLVSLDPDTMGYDDADYYDPLKPPPVVASLPLETAQGLPFTIAKNITKYNYTKGTSIERIQYIVIHYFGALGSAKSVADYFASEYRAASAHYCLDEGNTIYQCVEDIDISWHCGSSHPLYKNSTSIGIEVRPQKLDESTKTDATQKDWYFTQKTEDNLVIFVKYLMEKYNIPIENVVRHYDVTGKWCPRPWVGNDINTYYNETGNNLWKRFLQRLSEPSDSDGDGNGNSNSNSFTQEHWDAMMTDWQKRQAALQSSEWSADARAWAVENGIISGFDTGLYSWQADATREQIAQILHNYNNTFHSK